MLGHGRSEKASACRGRTTENARRSIVSKVVTRSRSATETTEASTAPRREPAPGPVMARFFVLVIGPLVRRMGEHEVMVEAKVIVDLEAAAATSARDEPAPESLQLVTAKVAALAT
jgi:hypothetical protein